MYLTHYFGVIVYYYVCENLTKQLIVNSTDNKLSIFSDNCKRNDQYMLKTKHKF